MEETKEIKFSETITVEDLQKVNYYSFKKQKKHLFNQVIFIAMSLLVIGLAIKEKDIPILIFGCVIFIFATIFFMPLYKKWIYRIVKKNAKGEMRIKLSFDDEGFTYLLEHEDPTQFPKFEYNQVLNVIEFPEYIFMFFTSSTIAIIKKSECSDIEELKTLLKDKYSNGLYVEKEKMPR